MVDFNSKEYNEYLKDQKEDNVAPGYDEKYLTFLESSILPGYAFKDKKILDIGSRTFDGWEYFIDKHDTRITGIDVGVDGLEYCRQRNKSGMIECDAHRMDEFFQGTSFDFITAFHSFEHMFDLAKVLHNCFKLLNAGGYLYFALPIPSYNWKKGHWFDVPDESYMIQLCKDAGFSTVLYSNVFPACTFRPEQEMLGLVQK